MMNVILATNRFLHRCLLLLGLLGPAGLQAQISPDNENFESLGTEVLQQTSGIRYKTVNQGPGKQLVFMQSVPGQQDSTTWGYVGVPGNYFNGYPNKALVYNYNRTQDGSANPSVGGYGIYRMLFSEEPRSATGQTIDTLSKLGNFRIRSIYVALGRNFGTESAVPSAVLLNFHGLRNGVSLVRPFITMRSGVENSASGSIVSGGVTILTYSAMDKHGGRTFTFVSDEWNFIDGLWISTAGTARLPVLVDNIQLDAPIPVPPNVRSTSLAATEEQTHEATLRWQNSGSTLNRGSWRLLLVKETDDEDELPPPSLLVARPGEIPAAIPRRLSNLSPGEQGLVGAYGATGTDLGDGWYCIYNDSHSDFPLTVTGLSPGKRYRAVVADYHGAKGFQTFMDNPFVEGQNAIGFQTLGNPPIIVTSGGETTFTESVEGDPVPVAIDGGLTITDMDNETLASATVAITDNFQSGEDVLAFANDGSTMGNIDGSYDVGVGVLTLNSEDATATLAQWQAAFRAVTYSNTSNTPNTANRTISFVAHDGTYESVAATKIVTVTAVNNPPVISAPEHVEAQEGETTVLGNISFSDADAGTGVVKATFSIPGGRGTLQAVSASGVDVTPTGSHTVVLEGTLAAINAFIAAGELTFTPAPDDVAEVLLTLSINDNGHTGGDGSARQTDSQLPIRVRPIIPEVVDVSSMSEDGIYGIGKTIEISIAFNHPVTVTGSPELLLETGETDRPAIYQSGSGSGVLVFGYTVQADDESNDLEYVSTGALSLNGGSIKSAAGTDADLTLPAPYGNGSLGANKAIAIDGVAPAAPTGFAALAGDAEVTLGWTANTEADLVDYRIYSGETAGPTTLLATIDKGTTTYLHTGLTNGAPYHYRIAAVDRAGNESAFSEDARATPVAGQTIAFEPLAAATYGDSPIALVATASSGLPVSFVSGDDALAEVFEEDNNWKMRLLRAGTVTITATQPGNAAFVAAEPVDRELMIRKATPVIAWEPPTAVTYGTALGDDQLATADVEGSFVYEPAMGTVLPSGTHTLKVTFTPDDADNYTEVSLEATLEIDRATLTGITLESARFVYDGTAKLLEIRGDLPPGTSVSYENNSRTDVGNQTVTATVTGANYRTLALTAVLEVVDPPTRTLDFPELPAKTYGDADFDAGATAGTEEPVSYTSSDASVAEVTSAGLIRITGAGETIITATVAEDPNYGNRPEVSRRLTVAKANQAITLSAPPEVNRDAGTVDITATATSGLPVSVSIDDPEVATLEGTQLRIHRLGTVRLTAAQDGDANHEPAEPETITVRVTDPASALPIRVNRAVSPNGDGINEFLIIEAIKDHPDNRVSIFNRNGTVVYEARGYNNGTVAFRGIGTGQHRVPAGTYFYVAEIKVNGRWEHEKGWFVLRY